MSLLQRRPFESNRYSMLEQVGRLMEYIARGATDGSDLGAWSPNVDVYDKDGKLVVEAKLSRVKKDDIDVHVDNGVLTIRG